MRAPEAVLPPGLESGRPFALLVYLAMRGPAGATRDELADLLWGDRDLRAGRRVLRQALYVIRKGLGPDALAVEGDRVRLQADLDLDVERFLAAIRGGDAAGALEVHGGPFLHGLEVSGAPAFDLWVDQERARLLGMLREATLTSVALDVEAARWGEALRHLELYLAQAPDDPSVLSLKAQVLDVSGRPMEASALARELLSRFVAEPEFTPDGETVETLRRLTASAPPDRRPESDPGNGLCAPAFTGRNEEYRALRDQWRAAAGGEGRVVLLAGDPGVGKTRLIEELLRVAQVEGATILRGKSYELEDGLLFGALVDVMAQALKAPGFAAVSDVWLSELARLLPELVEQYPRLASSGDEDAPGGRRRFHEAVAQVLEALAYEAPVICVLDDLHWADDATLELVHYLARRLCASPVLLLTGLRPGEASDTLRRLQRVLVEEHGGTCVDLFPLGRQPLADLVQSMGHGHAPPADVERTVWEASGGNPFLAVSAVRAMVDMAAVSVGPDGWSQPACGAGPAGIPEVWELVRGRIAGLPSQTRDLLELAAIVGRGFTAELLARASGEAPDSTRVHLEVLEGSRILKADRTNGVTRFDFAHDRLREAVYVGIDLERKADLHARVAQAMAGEEGLNACLMARHFHQAGDRDLAYRHALTGAAWARGVFAYGGELEMLELALANAPDAEARTGLEADVGRLRTRTGAHAPRGAPDDRSPGPRRAHPWVPAVASVAVVVAVGGWLALGGGEARARAAGPPELPGGLMVLLREADSARYVVVDPHQPRRQPIRVHSGQFAIDPTLDVGSLTLSPDLARVAFAVLDGRAPDVWIQERDGRALRRITTDPEDDVPAAWLPDGSGLLFRTLQGRSGATYGYSLAIAALDGSPVRLVTQGPWSDKAAAVSPDGSRIAVARDLMGTSLWVMDLDGSDGRQILTGLGPITRITWSPDGTSLAYFEIGLLAGRLVVLDLSAEPREPRVLAEDIQSGPVWSADGTAIFYAALHDENAEIFSVSPEGGTPTRLTHTSGDEYPIAFVGERTAYADVVEVLGRAGSHEVGLLSGDSVPMTAVTWSEAGNLMPGLEPELRCLDTRICRVAANRFVVGIEPGETELVADLGGWRADTTRVRVLDGVAEVALEESFETDLDPRSWRPYGDPRPYVGEGLGRSDSRGFVANGDAKYGSGIVTATSYPWGRGISVEFWARGEFDTGWPSFQGWDVMLAHAPPREGEGDVSPDVFVSLSVGNGGPDRVPTLLLRGLRVEPPEGWRPGGWHHYVLQLLPDTRCEVWVDGERRHQSDCPQPRSDRVWVALAGRATHAPVVHDDVRVWTGVRWR